MQELNHIQKIIAKLKHPGDFQAVPRIPILRKEQVVAFLRPVPSELKGLASDDSRLMAEWRNIHKTAFFTWITSTAQSTENWLNDKYASDNLDIIFMLETPERTPFGHVALYNFQSCGSACEFGRVLRGGDFGLSGGMTLGALALLHWASSKLKTERFFLEVFNDNKKAISLYERIGFRGTDTVPLRRKDSTGVTRWEKIKTRQGSGMAPDGYALKMEMTAEQLHAFRSG